MKKIIFLTVMISIILLVSLNFASAHENFTEAKKLVDEKVSCGNLTNEQLEEIGDYLMELMHPGEAHKQMHDIMGGEDSETVKQMHINMAKMMYCNNGSGMNNMMGMMSGGMMGNGMMSGNMMQGMMSGMMSGNMRQGMMSGMMSGNMRQGMMGNYWFGAQNSYWNFTNVLYTTLLIALIILVFLFIVKLLKSSKTKK